ncbi:iron-containing alcohol dehydrogenase [Bacteroides sp. 214]|uniref:iron-containing alcohol dehydrogenase n=1 Tax=Bacteroides sp. 214 TaxID=2302935 RepID=UPI0013D84E87|nr:iron-containing alcohol dehydrogenase [Bacteroides sp. 214]NDW12330.1 iron-containing alcohol dehydrogenase [Bacteroides sp. 214]
MKNFVYQNPTKLVFGKGQIAKLSELIPKEKKVMITFGGGSVKKNGVYDQVATALAGHQYIEFWGIEPNPSVETVREAVALGREHGVDFLLAVGGGSVLDGTKLIAATLGAREKIDPWSIVQKGFAPEAIPFASVMTLPATGSEMNSGAVISRKETNEKYAFGGNYPEFSILDPETTYSLPSTQIANGLSDVFVHVVEQYMTTPGQSRVMDRWAEGILLTLLDIAPKIKEDPKNYDVMADFMLSATLALNDMIQMGVTQDWATHMLGHELTALTGIAHGASLAIVYPAMLRVLKEQKHDKLLQYAERVFGITTGSEEERIDKAIEATEAYFKSLGLATHLSEAGIGEDIIAEVERRFTERGIKVGEGRNVDGKMARKVLESCK